MSRGNEEEREWREFEAEREEDSTALMLAMIDSMIDLLLFDYHSRFIIIAIIFAFFFRFPCFFSAFASLLCFIIITAIPLIDSLSSLLLCLSRKPTFLCVRTFAANFSSRVLQNR